jgi:hypothetical protein
MGLIGAFVLARLFGEETVARPGFRQLLDQDALGTLVGCGDEIGRSLERDLQVLQLAEVADQRPAGFARRRHQDVQGRGEIRHQASARFT